MGDLTFALLNTAARSADMEAKSVRRSMQILLTEGYSVSDTEMASRLVGAGLDWPIAGAMVRKWHLDIEEEIRRGRRA